MPRVIAFQGEHGAYSDEAIRSHDPEAQTLPCERFVDLFRAVLEGKADACLLPVENSIAGTVAQSYELLLDHDLRVQAEVILRVEHMLLAIPDTNIEQIKRVKSHPQALSQCEAFIRRRGYEPLAAYDTAGSARVLAAEPDPQTAVIASRLAGELYGLQILERGIEDNPYNSTRFFLLGVNDAPYNPNVPNKTSIVFATRHKPAALYECLGAFARNQINLTKLESRSRRSHPWQYWFYLDFEGHPEEPHVADALNSLLRSASFVKMLGAYPAAPMPTYTDNSTSALHMIPLPRAELKVNGNEQ
ncbi:MAG: bifunctional chorismate mutase/prephenate dehydratase [Phototrophicales bacterium]|nr:MAG: bifunctional chorismate mutase/prephenate dehydratase [Phototrophicales bacterium]